MHIGRQSTCTHTCRYPHKLISLPLDPSTLTKEERLRRQRKREATKARVYVEEEWEEDDTWDQEQYRDLIDK